MCVGQEYTINQLVGAAFGAAGQRCMALTTAIVVGEAKNWIPEVAEKAAKLRLSAGKPVQLNMKCVPTFTVPVLNLEKLLKMEALTQGHLFNFIIRTKFRNYP